MCVCVCVSVRGMSECGSVCVCEWVNVCVSVTQQHGSLVTGANSVKRWQL